jgi:hypothetical protein
MRLATLFVAALIVATLPAPAGADGSAKPRIDPPPPTNWSTSPPPQPNDFNGGGLAILGGVVLVGVGIGNVVEMPGVAYACSGGQCSGWAPVGMFFGGVAAICGGTVLFWYGVRVSQSTSVSGPRSAALRVAF